MRRQQQPIPPNVCPVSRIGDVFWLPHDSDPPWLERCTVTRVVLNGGGIDIRAERGGYYGATFNRQRGRYEAGLLGFPLLRRLPPDYCEQTGLAVSDCNCYQHCDNPDDLAERSAEI